MELVAAVIGGVCTLFAAFVVFLWTQVDGTERRRRQQVIDACESITQISSGLSKQVIAISNTAAQCARDPLYTRDPLFSADMERLSSYDAIGLADEAGRVAFAHGFDTMQDLFETLARVVSVLTDLSFKTVSDAKEIAFWHADPVRRSSLSESYFAQVDIHFESIQSAIDEYFSYFNYLISHIRTVCRFTQRNCTLELEVPFWERLQARLEQASGLIEVHERDDNVLNAINMLKRSRCEALSKSAPFPH